MNETLEDRILDLQSRDPRYSRNAYFFVLDSLDFSLEQMAACNKRDSHIGGKELLAGIRDLAKDRFGAMAKEVFNNWGICSTEDFGQVVFNLVTAGMLQRRAQDTLMDFENGYDFEREFQQDYELRVPWEEMHS